MSGTPLNAASAPWTLPALALWGWQTGLWPWALALGALLELPRIVSARVEISANDFNRLWNFTALLFLGAGLYAFLARAGLSTVGSIVTADSPGGRVEGLREIAQTIRRFLGWLPFIFFPFVLAHAWSRAGALPWSTFSLFAQARARRAAPGSSADAEHLRVHPGYLYIALTLFSSTGSASHPFLYQTLVLAVVLFALWPWRNPRFGWRSQAGLCVALLGVTLLAQLGVNRLRDVWQAWENRLTQSSGPAGFDQLRSVTAIGAVGRIKQSGRIVLRVRTSDGRAPGLLREGVYNRYRGQAWSSTYRDFEPVGFQGDGTVWRVASGRRFDRSLVISRATGQGEAQLALPADVVSVRDLPVMNIETNYLSAARLQDGPPIARYVAEAGEGGGFDGPAGGEDTDLETLGSADRKAIRRTAARLNLASLSAEAAVQAVERFFASGFEYSLWQRRPATTNGSALAAFLEETRAGHCEYFATATVLLLREAGVPTRYAVGYSPQSVRGEDWLARGRDAHAWCLAFVGGRWREIDTTPGIWREREAARAGWWEGVTDLFSQAWYRWTLWRQEGGNWQLAVFILGMAVLSWLAWRQLRGSRWRAARTRPQDSSGGPGVPGLDSELYPVIEQWEEQVGARRPEETLLAWARRSGLARALSADSLPEALRLHYRLRFDPRGLTESERGRLRALAQALAARSLEQRQINGPGG